MKADHVVERKLSPAPEIDGGAVTLNVLHGNHERSERGKSRPGNEILAGRGRALNIECGTSNVERRREESVNENLWPFLNLRENFSTYDASAAIASQNQLER
jgi:hypothetical protein